MRKFLVIICVAVLGCAAANAQKGMKGIGFNLNYGTEIENFGVGAKFQYGFTDHLRGELAFDYFFEKDHVHGWNLSADMHYLFNISGERLKLYPILGLTLANADGDFMDAVTKFGANIGAGVEYDVASNLSVNFQVKYAAVSKIDQAIIGLGATYRF